MQFSSSLLSTAAISATLSLASTPDAFFSEATAVTGPASGGDAVSSPLQLTTTKNPVPTILAGGGSLLFPFIPTHKHPSPKAPHGSSMKNPPHEHSTDGSKKPLHHKTDDILEPLHHKTGGIFKPHIHKTGDVLKPLHKTGEMTKSHHRPAFVSGHKATAIVTDTIYTGCSGTASAGSSMGGVSPPYPTGNNGTAATAAAGAGTGAPALGTGGSGSSPPVPTSGSKSKADPSPSKLQSQNAAPMATAGSLGMGVMIGLVGVGVLVL